MFKSSPGNDGRVLVVEDEDSIRRLLNDGLTAEGFTVHTASTPGEAIAHLERERPDVVLLDLMLAGRSGLDLAETIHRRWTLVIIAMSASHSLLNLAADIEGVKETIRKPFEWDRLVEELHSCVATAA